MSNSFPFARVLALFGLAAMACLAIPAPAQDAAAAPAKPRTSLIIMIADGTGPEAITAARLVKGSNLELDDMLLGLQKTMASDTPVTDSAASATSIASGIITLNGRIGTDIDKKPVATISEAAAEAGYATALVATSRITHATPAAFSAHTEDRGTEDEIAAQQVASKIELLLGGGRRQFNKRRADTRNLLDELKTAGATVLTTVDELLALDPKTEGRIFGLFADSHLPYEIDRAVEGGPSLVQMTSYTLEWAEARRERGFVIMIEGSRVDHAAHGNDPVAMITDLIEFDRAVGLVKKFAAEDGNTLVIITSDHATGGFSIGANGVYDFDVESLRAAKASGERLGRSFDAERSNISAVLTELAGFTPTEEEIAEIKAATGQYEPGNTITKIISRRIFAGWTTSGHTGVDVLRFGMGPHSEQFRNTMHHAEVGVKLQEVMGLREVAEGLTAQQQEEFAKLPPPAPRSPADVFKPSM